MVKKKYDKTKTFKRSEIDRRDDTDRRHAFSLDYFENNPERRRFLERRSSGEKRSDWIRYSTWHSVYIGEE